MEKHRIGTRAVMAHLLRNTEAVCDFLDGGSIGYRGYERDSTRFWGVNYPSRNHTRRPSYYLACARGSPELQRFWYLAHVVCIDATLELDK